MTFCLAIKVQGGLVALADTRVVKGDETLSKGKLETIQHHERPVFVMTSGLRSVRDKVMIYLKEHLQRLETPHDKLYHLANAFGAELRKVRSEDGASLELNGLAFNTHAIIGGQLAGDQEPMLFYVYPAGNWIESTRDSPYFMIGRTSYGKPVLDRLLRHEVNLATALNLGFLAFDATRTSVTDVDFPLDVLVCRPDGTTRQNTYTEHELHDISQRWQQCLSDAVAKMPREWMRAVLDQPKIRE